MKNAYLPPFRAAFLRIALEMTAFPAGFSTQNVIFMLLSQFFSPMRFIFKQISNIDVLQHNEIMTQENEKLQKMIFLYLFLR